MSALAGQAAHVLRRVIGALLALLLLASALVLLLAWRLADRPLALHWVAHRIEAAAHERGVDLRVGRVALAWSGFRVADAPLELVVADVRTEATDRAGAPLASLARAEASFALPPLLLGRIVPRTLAVAGLRADLARQADGGISLGLPADGPASLSRAATRARAAPPRAFGGAAPAWRQLRDLHLHDVTLSLYDAPTGLAASLAAADLDLARAPAGGLAGHGALTLAAGDQSATLTLESTPAELSARLTPLSPAALARLSPALAPLATLDAPVTLAARATPGPGLLPSAYHVAIGVGAGTVHAGTGTAPLVSAAVQLDGTPTRLDGTVALRTAPRPDGPLTRVDATLAAAPTASGWQAQVAGTVDRVSFADLPALWPAGTGGTGSRPWITKNIPTGDLSGGRIALVLTLPSDFSDVKLAAIDAAIDGRDLEVHWLRPVPPMLHAAGHLTVTDPDVIDIAVTGAQQAGGGLVYRSGHVHLTGIAAPDQFGDFETDLDGPLADLLAVLNNPKMQLLSKRPVPMADPSGHVAAHVAIGHLPLRDDVTLDDLAIRTTAHLTDVHLGGIAAGRDLSQGTLELAADNDGLRVSGRATVAGIPATLRVGMDFRAGPPDQIVQSVDVTGTIDAPMLAREGVDLHGLVQGGGTLHASLRSQRGGRGDLLADADLTDTAMDVPAIGFAKPAGQKTEASLHVVLDGDRLAAIEQVHVAGPAIALEARADVADGRPELLRIERLRLGTGTQAQGTVRLPARPGDPFVVALSGPSLDASAPFRAQTDTAKPDAAKPAAAKPAPEPGEDAGPGKPFVVDARFDQVLLGDDRRIEAFEAHAENDGHVIRAARVSGRVAGGNRGEDKAPAPFRMAIEPAPPGRRATATVPDAGALLATLGVADSIRGGALALDGTFDDSTPAHRLSGTLTMRRFRVLDAPLVARILKAATLYGIVDLLRGPGVGFTSLTIPFDYQDGVFDLRQARVVSPSLGGTAEGTVAVRRRMLDLRGTIVPLYALNTLPGRIPLVGRLFSPEKSGGLFAATYAVRGGFDDPDVSVDPLATIAPGVLRKLFGLF